MLLLSCALSAFFFWGRGVAAPTGDPVKQVTAPADQSRTPLGEGDGGAVVHPPKHARLDVSECGAESIPQIAIPTILRLALVAVVIGRLRRAKEKGHVFTAPFGVTGCVLWRVVCVFLF